MSILEDAAHTIENSWCKGDLKREGEARDAGDAYCSIGALVHTMATPLNLAIDWEADVVGPKDNWNNEKAEGTNEVFGFYDENWHLAEDVVSLYNFMDKQAETKALADVIIENYHDRIETELTEDDMGVASRVVYVFNDHDDTTREEVVAVFKEAAKRV